MKKQVLVVQPIRQSGTSLFEKEVEVIHATDPSGETVCREIKGVLAATKRKILVLNTPYVNMESVAEHRDAGRTPVSI